MTVYNCSVKGLKGCLTGSNIGAVMQADMGRGRCEIAANTTETDNHAAPTTAAPEGSIQYRTIRHLPSSP